jgi:hypothetical protein
MELIKKTVKYAMTTGTTSGCTSTENCYVIIPDTGATYTFKILLTSEIKDLGIFDAAKDEDIENL